MILEQQDAALDHLDAGPALVSCIKILWSGM